jgi:hypothetical protein
VNTGERLASLSSLPSGSAMAHLLALQAGTGAGDSFYSGTVRVVTSKSGVSVQHKAKRPAIERKMAVQRIPERQKKARSIVSTSILSPRNTAHSFTQQNEVFVLTRSVNATTVMTATNLVSATKKAN